MFGFCVDVSMTSMLSAIGVFWSSIVVILLHDSSVVVLIAISVVTTG
ncbi:MAG: hypothetical protein LBU56_01610 [Rickettsiales bacterium]|nr:hypothetical protein [Rickettsiales bacterium]